MDVVEDLADEVGIGTGAQEARLQSRAAARRRAGRGCNDTVGGNSGGSGWNDRNNALFSSGAWAFGIHGYGVGGSVCGGAANQMNGAVRMVSPVRTNIINWIILP